MFDRLDVGVDNTRTTEEIVGLVREAEDRGLARFWLAEQFPNRGVIAQVAAAAEATARIEIGFGILSPFGRHPALIAMEVAGLVERSGPRFVLGLGASHGTMKALRADQPVLTGLREAGEICRGLLAGERVSYDGSVFGLDGEVELGVALSPSTVPLFFGTMGPRTLEMAGGAADGVLLGALCSPEYVRGLVERVHEGADRAGRSPDEVEVAGILITSVAEDREAARRAARPVLAYYLMEIPDASPRMVGTGIARDSLLEIRSGLLEAERRGDLDRAVAELPDDLVDVATVAGTPAECVERLRGFAEVGMTAPVLYGALGPDPLAALALIAGPMRDALVEAST